MLNLQVDVKKRIRINRQDFFDVYLNNILCPFSLIRDNKNGTYICQKHKQSEINSFLICIDIKENEFKELLPFVINKSLEAIY